jgi:hypothetical protein
MVVEIKDKKKKKGENTAKIKPNHDLICQIMNAKTYTSIDMIN